jgi:hypothetical protein
VTVAPQVGTEGANVHVRMSVPVQIPVYDNSAFKALVRDRIAGTVAAVNQSGGGAKEVVPNSIASAPPVQLGIEGKVVHFQTEVHGTLRAVITGQDATRIGRIVAAKATRDARLTIAADPGIGRFAITNGPSWLPTQIRDRMPQRASNISVRIMAAA